MIIYFEGVRMGHGQKYIKHPDFRLPRSDAQKMMYMYVCMSITQASVLHFHFENNFKAEDKKFVFEN